MRNLFYIYLSIITLFIDLIWEIKKLFYLVYLAFIFINITICVTFDTIYSIIFVTNIIIVSTVIINITILLD